MDQEQGLKTLRSVQAGIYRSITPRNEYSMEGPDDSLYDLIDPSLFKFIRPERPVDCFDLVKGLTIIAGELLPGLTQLPYEIALSAAGRLLRLRLEPKRYAGEVDFFCHCALALNTGKDPLVFDPNLLPEPEPLSRYIPTTFIHSDHLQLRKINLA